MMWKTETQKTDLASTEKQIKNRNKIDRKS